jgi:citrate lyase subunit beta/citryl-CoA lyase
MPVQTGRSHDAHAPVRLRSLLFVPGDSEKKIARSGACGADALILDLEDSVAPSRKAHARDLTASFLSSPTTRTSAIFVRINALRTPLWDADLDAIVRPGLDGLLLPKSGGGADVDRLADLLALREERLGMPPGAVKIAAVATETPHAVLNLTSYTPAHPRLCALTWGAEDLSATLGATTNKLDNGEWTFPYQVARALCLFAAAAAGTQALDTLYSDYTDLAGLERACLTSRRDGFSGRVAIHPAQVPIINAAYAPSPAEVEAAQRVVQAFAAQPNAGVISLDGKMYDMPHLIAAQRTLATAGEHG